MHIGIIGASGNFGRRILAEASSRGHPVTGFSRNPVQASEAKKNIIWKAIDVLDPESIDRAVGGLDVLISCYGPGGASRDAKDVVERAVANAETCVVAARSLVKALEKHPSLRLIVLGGAGSLEVEPGLQLVDWPGYIDSMRDRGMDERYRAVTLAHRDALNAYRTSNRNWTYLSPAMQNFAGERTGRFRIGGNQLMRDSEGNSRISYEDCAVAILNEIELPNHIGRRFSIAY